MKFPTVWNLERIFEGGSRSSSFQKAYQALKSDLDTLEKLLQDQKISKGIDLMQKSSLRLREMESFAYCLASQNTKDVHAHTLIGQMRKLRTNYSNALLTFSFYLKQLSDKDFDSLLQKYPSITFPLKEKRRQAQDKLSLEEEIFINNLAMDGYHGYAELWETLIGEMSFPFQKESLSFGQIENKIADPCRNVRHKAFEVFENEFNEKKQSFAQILNHLSGFRLQVYQKRKWNDILKEPLDENRQSKASLMAMWKAIKNRQNALLHYYQCKSDLLGVNRLSWHDLEAPISPSTKTISYQEAAQTILEQFETFSPKMASFAEKVLKNGWIEGEDRKDKGPGGFCIALPLLKESRIFMTFSGSITNLYTLAHELGHAFHNEIIFPLNEMVHHSSMGLAETASTMAEMIVTQGSIQKESDPKKRLLLLDDFLGRSTAFLLNIYVRFLFELRFYEVRKQGVISAEELSKLMCEVQKEAYGDSLQDYHPHFWAAKGHFYCTELPFYNFPYTFGFLFSLGILNDAKEKSNFESSYIALLEDTGRMTPEDLAKKHLNVDLKAPDFWEKGIGIILKHLDEFIRLSKEVTL